MTADSQGPTGRGRSRRVILGVAAGAAIGGAGWWWHGRSHPSGAPLGQFSAPPTMAGGGVPGWRADIPVADGQSLSTARTAIGTDGRLLYIYDTAGVVYALDLADGALRWQAPAPGPLDYPILPLGGVVIVSGYTTTGPGGLAYRGFTLALDRATGRRAWLASSDRSQTLRVGPADGTVLIVDSAGMRLVTAATNTVRWTAPGPFDATAVTGDLIVASAPRDAPAVLTALDVDGSVRWAAGVGAGEIAGQRMMTRWISATTTGTVHLVRSPTVIDINASDAQTDRLLAHNSTDGRPLWSFTARSIEDQRIDGSTIYVVYLPDLSGRVGLRAIDAATGASRWVSEHAAAGLYRPTFVDIDSGVICLQHTGGLVGVRATTGERLWSVTQPSANEPIVSPVITGGVIYMARPSRGLRRWRVPDGVQGTLLANSISVQDPLVGDRVLYAASRRSVYAIPLDEPFIIRTDADSSKTAPSAGVGEG